MRLVENGSCIEGALSSVTWQDLTPRQVDETAKKENIGGSFDKQKRRADLAMRHPNRISYVVTAYETFHRVGPKSSTVKSHRS